ncbi:type II secretion system protein GspM [Pleionea sp. CnH1-48]|uniref:type II secretion system protein GspM n=1 Tax=Pleionea sp. CnH1-48 TaxID=2954494 RepID=UPI002097A0CE|nr:type II secretion system protein M [Pleionea sp. CnH1-48]MCO7225195.1 type II secretion system protein M [Pleionea sp. CnH1-48]
MNALLEKYEQLSERDQLAAKIIAIAAVVGILIFGILMPINNAVNELESDVSDNRKAIVMLQEAAPQAGGNSRGKQSYRSLSDVVTRTSRSNGFSLSRIEEKKNGELQVWFDRIAFDKMISWLANLQNTYGISSSDVAISQTSEVGIVRANVRLVGQ